MRGRITRASPPVKIAWLPLVINVAPKRPPTSAWVEEDGIPCHHEKKVQTSAATMAITIVSRVTADVLIRSVVIDWATAEPKKKGAIKSAAAPKYNASRGFIAREAITPARMLEESRYPFRNA